MKTVKICAYFLKCTVIAAYCWNIVVPIWIPDYYNRPISQIPQCIRQIPHNAPFCNRNVHMCAHFCYKMMHCWVLDLCIMGFVQQVYWSNIMCTCVGINSLRPGDILCICEPGHHWFRSLLIMIWHQSLTWTSADLSSTLTIGRNFNEISIKVENIFVEDNAFENMWTRLAILFAV